MSDENKWIAFMLKQRYINQQQKLNLKKNIMMRFNLKQKDICYSSSNNNSGHSYYFFVKEYDSENDLRNIYQTYSNFFEHFNYHVKINQSQLKQLFKSIYEINNINIKFGDLVVINKGVYSKLHGIVLRKNRNGKYDVGLKFGFGTLLKSYNASQLTITGNIFNYIKVLR